MMGRGTITGGGTDGLYTIAIDFGKATRDARVAKMDERISVLNIEIAAAEASVAAAESAASVALSALSAAINAMADALEEGGPEAAALATVAVKRAEEEVAKATSAELAARAPRDQRIFERTSLVDRKRALLAAKVEDTRQAWCADLTEDATGEVATIEIPGEDQAILIAPGGRAPEDSDGRLMARELMTPEQVFFNAALLPGWQKWKPSYRKATITAIDEEAGTVDVDLDQATSSAKRLNVNQAEALAGVEVVYMDCNADAFEAGDRVVVEFVGADWAAPRVIGFVEQPRPCAWICRGGDLVATGLYFECLHEGLVDSLVSGAASVSGWFNEAGPTAMPFEGGGLYRSLELGPFDRVEFQIYAAFVPAFFAHPTLGDQPFGGVTLYALPPRGWEPLDPEPSILEVVVRLGGSKKLHIAITSIDGSGAKVKAAPISPELLGTVPVTRLLDYTFVGS